MAVAMSPITFSLLQEDLNGDGVMLLAVTTLTPLIPLAVVPSFYLKLSEAKAGEAGRRYIAVYDRGIDIRIAKKNHLQMFYKWSQIKNVHIFHSFRGQSVVWITFEANGHKISLNSVHMASHDEAYKLEIEISRHVKNL